MTELIKTRIKTIVSILVIGLTILYFFSNSCSREPKAGSTTKTDTVYITKTIKIPEVKGNFETKNPKPKDGVMVYDRALLNKYNDLKSENEKLKAYQKAVEIKEYENTYKYEKDEKVTITVSNTVTGSLTNQKVSFNIPEREIEYKERIITNTTTEKLKPSFIISGGVSAQSSTDLINLKPSVGLTVGFKNKSGYTLDVNYNTNRNVMITLKKDILTFWSKKE